jgi:hypothetical protein
MTTGLPEATDVSAEPRELLRTMLEESFAVHTTRLTQLTRTPSTSSRRPPVRGSPIRLKR